MNIDTGISLLSINPTTSLAPASPPSPKKPKNLSAYRLQLLSNRAFAYSLGRPPYPIKMFHDIKRIIASNQRILDIGCGNGRATIPLRKIVSSKIKGLDTDAKMIEELERKSLLEKMKIRCKKGRAEDLRSVFAKKIAEGKLFDAVCAFSSLTLFDNDVAIKAIYDVLSPNGVFIEAGDEGAKIDVMGRIMRHIFNKALGIQLKVGVIHDEEAVLLRNGFKPLERRDYKQEESYSFEQTVAHFKSRLIYPEMPIEDDKKVLDCLRLFLQPELHDEADLKFLSSLRDTIQLKIVSGKICYTERYHFTIHLKSQEPQVPRSRL